MAATTSRRESSLRGHRHELPTEPPRPVPSFHSVPFPYHFAESTHTPLSETGGPSYIPAPDDADVNNRMPSICVDYLSHEWREDDIWSSWKAMTRQKNEIANGVRLENASWRTWAKQRNNLKTVSPETLNWLKDSDVTWLYGPLHTAEVQPVPTPVSATTEQRLNLIIEGIATPASGVSISKRLSADTSSVSKKPILKHKSITDILGSNRGSSPTTEAPPFDFPKARAGPSAAGQGATVKGDPSSRLAHTRSDTNLFRAHAAATRQHQPWHKAATAALSEEPPLRHNASGTSLHRATSADRQQEKRHISFNNRVEQCIAVEREDDHNPKLALQRRANGRQRSPAGSSSHYGSFGYAKDLNSVQEQEEYDAVFDDDVDESSSGQGSSDSDHGITMRKGSRSGSGSKAGYFARAEPHNIARMEPTTLKTDILFSPTTGAPQWAGVNPAYGHLSLAGRYNPVLDVDPEPRQANRYPVPPVYGYNYSSDNYSSSLYADQYDEYKSERPPYTGVQVTRVGHGPQTGHQETGSRSMAGPNSAKGTSSSRDMSYAAIAASLDADSTFSAATTLPSVESSDGADGALAQNVSAQEQLDLARDSDVLHGTSDSSTDSSGSVSPTALGAVVPKGSLVEPARSAMKGSRAREREKEQERERGGLRSTAGSDASSASNASSALAPPIAIAEGQQRERGRTSARSCDRDRGSERSSSGSYSSSPINFGSSAGSKGFHDPRNRLERSIPEENGDGEEHLARLDGGFGRTRVRDDGSSSALSAGRPVSQATPSHNLAYRNKQPGAASSASSSSTSSPTSLSKSNSSSSLDGLSSSTAIPRFTADKREFEHRHFSDSDPYGYAYADSGYPYAFGDDGSSMTGDLQDETDGLVGRVGEVVSTAKEIAGVIWGLGTGAAESMVGGWRVTHWLNQKASSSPSPPQSSSSSSFSGYLGTHQAGVSSTTSSTKAPSSTGSEEPSSPGSIFPYDDARSKEVMDHNLDATG